jgi:hypothetical protein
MYNTSIIKVPDKYSTLHIVAHNRASTKASVSKVLNLPKLLTFSENYKIYLTETFCYVGH